MINRINLILKAKNITARQFAEEIGIQPSGMSHIMSGRNNPSLEFVNKVVRRYPEIDANWLLLGRGEMYMTSGLTPAAAVSSSAVEPTLFSMPETVDKPSVETPQVDMEAQSDGLEAQNVDVVTRHEDVETPIDDNRETQPTVSIQMKESLKQTLQNEPVRVDKKPSLAPGEGRRLVKILMFYDDHTFEEYRPQ